MKTANFYGFEVDRSFGGTHPKGVVAESEKPVPPKEAPVGTAEFGDRKSLLILKAYLENQLAQINELLKK